MKISIVNGTDQKGCTHAMKEMFITAMGGGHEINEFTLPRDCPVFCTGCKACFANDIYACPHARYTVPIWESLLAADLLVFTSPVYVFHVTAQMKALLDHFATKWMVHSPDGPMFAKQAVVITNAIGQGLSKTARDITDSLDFWGVARVYVIKQAMFQGEWRLVSAKRKTAVQRQCEKHARMIKRCTRVKPRFKIKGLFALSRLGQILIDRSERKAGRERTKDYRYWKEHGWLDGRKPWTR